MGITQTRLACPAGPGLGPGIFRSSPGPWAVVNGIRGDFGAFEDTPVPADYACAGLARTATFREAPGPWALRGLIRICLGAAANLPSAR